MFTIKDKKAGNDKELELVYDNNGDIDLKIDGEILLTLFQDRDVTLQKDILEDFDLDLLGWERS